LWPRTWNALFPGMQVLGIHPFRVVRNADFEIQELEAADLLETVEEGVRRRRFGEVVRLTVRRGIADRVLRLLAHELEVDPLDVYRVEGVLGLSDPRAARHPGLGRTCGTAHSSPPCPRAWRRRGRTSTCSPPSGGETSSSTTPTTRSCPWWTSCARPRATPTCWPSR
jgi:hypothetical protein